MPRPSRQRDGDDGKYRAFQNHKKAITSDELIHESGVVGEQYPIILLRMAWEKTIWDGWRNLTVALGAKIELVGRRYFCTTADLQQGSTRNPRTRILIKLNQIGTVTESSTRWRWPGATANAASFTQIGQTEDTLYCGSDGLRPAPVT